ncbi:MAG TPA: DUF438 domain-containing protein [Terriglobales bacterium]|nr:DUF438 domain-containing protein [Terriglobales bacterium]
MDPREAPHATREKRIAALRSIIEDLHRGGDVEEARRRFAQAVGDVEASEIAAMEEQMIRSGLPVSEVQRLCDVHVGAVRQALDRVRAPSVPPGHPVDTYRADNRILEALAGELGAIASDVAGAAPAGWPARAMQVLDGLAGLENHYRRKENQLFPLLERHGVTGPPQVMWGVHDEIRARLRETRAAAVEAETAAFARQASGLARAVIEMVFKEEKILFPLALQTLSEPEWVAVRHGEEEVGYALARPAAEWSGGDMDPLRIISASPPPAAPAAGPAAAPSFAAAALLDLDTGRLALDQINLVLTHLPVDLSFVDETDTVRYYSAGKERIFPRAPQVIGRKVQNCHPPASVHVVNDILESFRAGRQDVAEFWIQLRGRFVHIRYFAVRDAGGRYRGCLEVSQDVTGIRALEGERRLLAWENAP